MIVDQTRSRLRDKTSPGDERQIECGFNLEGAGADSTAEPLTGNILADGLTDEDAEDMR
jgi:hypothetical protein